MTIYAVYTRTEKGSIQRDHLMFDWDGPLGPYVHETPLAGWPESKVYWIYEKGYSKGLAPIGGSSSHPSGYRAIRPVLDSRP
ncbi:MAG: hypothetical protein ABI270_05575 [Nitrosospira sp.]